MSGTSIIAKISLSLNDTLNRTESYLFLIKNRIKGEYFTAVHSKAHLYKQRY